MRLLVILAVVAVLANGNDTDSEPWAEVTDVDLETTAAPEIPNPPEFCLIFPPETAQTDVVFLADHSSHVCRAGPDCANSWALVVDSMKAVIEYLQIDDEGVRVSLVIYEDQSQVIFSLTTTDKRTLINGFESVKTLEPGDQTNLADGIRDSRDIALKDSTATNKLIIIMASGEPTVETDRTAAEVTQTLAAGIQIFAVGTNDAISKETLAAVSSIPNEEYLSYYRAASINDLLSVPYFLLSAVCMPFDTIMDPPLDMVFVLDGSSSVCEEDFSYRPDLCPQCTCNQWESMKNMVNRVIDELVIGEFVIRFGLVTTEGEGARVHIKLDDYYNKAELQEAISGIYFPNGTTNVPEALRSMREDVFNQAGDRADANNVAVVVLDSESDPRFPIQQEVYTLSTSNTRVFAMGVLGTTISEFTIRSIASLPKQYERTYFGSSYGGLDYARYQLITNGGFKDTILTCTWNLEGSTNLVLVVDHSNNTCQGTADEAGCLAQWEDVLDMATSVVNQVDLDYVNVAMVTYGQGDASVAWNFGSYTGRDDLRQKVLSLKTLAPGGTANAEEALNKVRTDVLPTANATNELVVVISTGPTISDGDTLNAAKVLQLRQVHMFVVGAGQSADEDFIRELSSLPRKKDKSYVLEPDYVDLVKVPYLMFQETCLELTTRVSPPMDLVFAVDGSLSVCGLDYNSTSDSCPNWEEMKEFINEIIDVLDVDSGAVQVGLVSTERLASQIRWSLDGYKDKASLKAAVSSMGFPASISSMPTALSDMRQNMFTTTADRRDADNVAVILVEGDPDPDYSWADETAALHDAGIKSYSVGFLGQFTISYLSSMASLPREEWKTWFVCYYYESDECRTRLIESAGFTSDTALTTPSMSPDTSSMTSSMSSTPSATDPATPEPTMPDNGAASLTYAVSVGVVALLSLLL